MILFIYRSRGILIPIFIIIPFIAVLIVKGELDRNFGGIFGKEFCSQIFIGFGLLISSIWAYLTSFDYITIDGEKEKIEMGHHFFLITNRNWSFIMLGLGIFIILGGILEFFTQ